MQPIRVSWGKKKTLPSRSSVPEVNKDPEPTSSNLPADINLPSLSQLGSTSYAMNSLPSENLPSRIAASYTDDFNILEVHTLILKRFEVNRDKRIEALRRELAMEQKKVTIPQTVIERKITLNTIESLQDQIEFLLQRKDITTYQTSVAELIKTYQKLGTTQKVVSFKKNPTLQPLREDEETARLRHQTIRDYLEIARQYLQIDVIREIPISEICPGCGLAISEMIVDEEMGTSSCPQCGIEKCNLIRSPLNEANINPNTRNGYDDRDNFYKALVRYQGKQANRLPKLLIPTLDTYFASFKLPLSDDVKNLPFNADSYTRGPTTREMMYRALYETGYATYYEDVNLICHLYWGWKLPDISHIEELIMDDYDKTQQVYESLPKNRKSNLNTQYRLFKHLQLRQWSCSIDDFKMVKTREILEYHDATWKLMVTGVNLPFIPTI